MLYEPRRSDIITFVGLGVTCYDFVSFSYRRYEVEDNQIWTINSGVKLFQHDVCFDVHVPEWLNNQATRKQNPNPAPVGRRVWMQKHDRPIVLAKADPLIPTSLTFPLKSVIERTKSSYFTTGMAYMFACVWIVRPKVLRLFGCDFTYDREAKTHDEPGRACCEWWCGRLVERGVKIEISNNTHFLDMKMRGTGHLYGYNEPSMFTAEPGKEPTFVSPDYSIGEEPWDEAKYKANVAAALGNNNLVRTGHVIH